MLEKEAILKLIESINDDGSTYVFDASHLHAVLDNFAKQLNHYRTLEELDAPLLDEVLAQLIAHKTSLTEHHSTTTHNTPHWNQITELQSSLQKLLNKSFHPITLMSENEFAQLPNLPEAARKPVAAALADVYASKLRHQRLKALLKLEAKLYPFLNFPALQTLRDTTRNMIKVFMNAKDDQDLVEKLAIRDRLTPYLPEFVTMPPTKTPSGRLLRELLEYETSQSDQASSRKTRILKNTLRHHGTHKKQDKPSESQHDIRKRLERISQQGHRQALPTKRKLYVSLLVPDFFRAIARGDIRPIDFNESVKNRAKGKVEYDSLVLETKRLYPYSPTQMLLRLESTGKGKDQTLCFYPFRTKGMSINRHIHNRAMLVIDDNGNFFADSTTPYIVHSSLAQNIFFAGYIHASYGRWTEIGTYCGSFKTNERNALNCVKFLCDELDLFHLDSHPIFYLDNRHSEHLLSYIIDHHRSDLYQLIYQKPRPKNITLYENFDSIAKFFLNRDALHILNYQEAMASPWSYPIREIPLSTLSNDCPDITTLLNALKKMDPQDGAYQDTKAQLQDAILANLRQHYHLDIPEYFFPVLTHNASSLSKFGYELRKNTFNSSSSALGSGRVFLYQQAFRYQNMMTRGFQRYAAQVVLLGCQGNDRYPEIERAQSHFDDSIYYREQMHHLQRNDLANSERRLFDFLLAPTNQDRSKTWYQRKLQNIMKNQYLGTLLAGLIYGAYNTLCFVYLLDFFPLPFVLWSTLGITLASWAYDATRFDATDLTTGWNNSSILTIFVYMLACTAMPIPATMGGGHVLCALLGLLAIGIGVALLLQSSKVLIEQLNDSVHTSLGEHQYTHNIAARKKHEQSLANTTHALIDWTLHQNQHTSPRSLLSEPILTPRNQRKKPTKRALFPDKTDDHVEIAPATNDSKGGISTHTLTLSGK